MSCGELGKGANFDSLFDGSDAHLLPSSPEDCAAKLQQYNRWRRGEDLWPDEDGPNLKELMLLIDYAADALEPKVCCGEFETCRAMCVPRASYFKWQRDDLLEVLEGVERRCRSAGFVGLDGKYLKHVRAVIARVKGSAA